MRTLIGIVIAATAVSILLLGNDVSLAAYNAVLLCGKTVIPSLFPFFVVSTVIVKGGFGKTVQKLLSGAMPAVFNTDGAASLPFFLGIISGYPVGAATAAELYEKGKLGKYEAEDIAVFCNNAGPAYVIGSVGAGIFGSIRLGAGLYIAELLGAVTAGWILGRKRKNAGKFKTAKTEMKMGNDSVLQVFLDSVRDSAGTVINICAFIIFFAVLISILKSSGVFGAVSSVLGAMFAFAGINGDFVSGFITGAFELTSGAAAMAEASGPLKLGLLGLVIGWSGLCVNMQTLAVIKKSGFSAARFLKGKLLVGTVTFFYAAAVSLIMGF